MGAGVEV